jgi:hypothetical protein
MGEELPPEVRELVARRLRSMEEVDALLLLAGNSDNALTIREIRERLRLPESALAPSSIVELERNGLVATEPGDTPRYRYAPESVELRKAVGLLAQAYHERPVTLVRLVYHRPGRAQTF